MARRIEEYHSWQKEGDGEYELVPAITGPYHGLVTAPTIFATSEPFQPLR